MYIYLDFEATQFSYEIISIGAVKENGETFYSLVRPQNIKKITPLITKITGLTSDMYTEEIPTICDIFPTFVDWAIKENNQVKFFTYGGFDKTLISHCVKRYPEYAVFQFVYENMIDIQKIINLLMNSEGVESKSLVAIYEYLFGNNHGIEHNALSDAQMLFYIHKHAISVPLENIIVISENEVLNRIVRKFKKGKSRNRKIKEYLLGLGEFELETLSIHDIISVDKTIKNVVDEKIKSYYYNLHGRELRHFNYEG